VAMRGTTASSEPLLICMPSRGECTALVVLPPGHYLAFARLRPMESTPSLRSADVAINVP
jgi:hypothetical protein